MVGIVAFVSDHPLKLVADKQRLSLSNIVTLTGGQHKAKRITQRINRDVNFGAEATATAT